MDMNDATRAFAGRMADDLEKQWDAFGAPDSVSMALMDVHSAALGAVCEWTPDVMEVYAGEDADWRSRRDRNPVGFGAYLVDWLARLVADRLSDVIDPLPGALDPDPDSDPDRCPRCGSASIEGGGFDVDAPLAWQECRCDECEHSWRDVYRIVAQESDDE